jgi:putative DNA primase/helicase
VNIEQVKADVVGRWPGVYERLGINVGDGRHGPCPMCGGKDRFRFDDKDGNGTWICNQCGAGDGFALVGKVLSLDFVETCESIGKIVGTVEAKVNPEKETSPDKLRELYINSTAIEEGDPVTAYLRNRGLSVFPSVLRYAPKCWEYETKREQHAMLAVFSLADGEAVTIHRTYIKEGRKLNVDAPRKVMPPLKKMNGGAVRLFPPDNGEILGVAEGIETAIACHELHYQVPVWATLSASLMESFIPPDWAKQVWIFGDNDSNNYTGQKAAYVLANRLVREGKKVTVGISNGGDFLDDLIDKAQ